MKIKLVCPEGHYLYIQDGNHSVPPLEKLNMSSDGRYICAVCRKPVNHAYESIDVELVDPIKEEYQYVR